MIRYVFKQLRVGKRCVYADSRLWFEMMYKLGHHFRWYNIYMCLLDIFHMAFSHGMESDITSLHSIFSSISLSKLTHSSIETDRVEVLTSLSIG